jgi:glycosyltransferase involved in cell wall biosynthesis
MRRTLVIIYQWDPFGEKMGGIERFTRGLIEHAPDDFEIEFIGITSNAQSRPVGKWMEGFVGKKEISFLPVMYEKDEGLKKTIPLSLRFAAALLFSRIEMRSKVLFFNKIENCSPFLLTKAAKIAVIHSDIERQLIKGKSEVAWREFPLLYYWFENIAFRYLDRIFVINKETLRYCETRYKNMKYKFKHISTWVDTDIFHPSLEGKTEIKKITGKRFGIPAGFAWILFVGRLQEVKAPLRLIEAFDIYLKRNDKTILIMAGEGNMRQEVEKAIGRLSLKDKVFLVGNIPVFELAGLYQSADVLVLTSNSEAMPMSVLEALGSGLPVVSTNVGEVSAVVKNGITGEVIESFEAEDIAAGIDKVLSKPNIYTVSNCLNSVKGLTPQYILKTLYDTMRALNHG